MPQRAENLVSQRAMQNRGMAVAGDAVEQYPCHRDVRAKGGEAVYQGRGGLRLVPGIDGEDDGQSQAGGQVGGRTGRAIRSVEEAHDAFDDDDVGVTGRDSEAGVQICALSIAQGSRLKQGRPVAAS